ncbi:MAG: hypothetical protein ACOYEQ_09350 [Bacillota bacterium]
MNLPYFFCAEKYTPPEFQGRVFSVRRVIAQFTAPIGTFIGGWLARAMNPSVLLVILGIMAAGFAGLQMLDKDLVEMETGNPSNKDYLMSSRCDLSTSYGLMITC